MELRHNLTGRTGGPQLDARADVSSKGKSRCHRMTCRLRPAGFMWCINNRPTECEGEKKKCKKFWHFVYFVCVYTQSPVITSLWETKFRILPHFLFHNASICQLFSWQLWIYLVRLCTIYLQYCFQSTLLVPWQHCCQVPDEGVVGRRMGLIPVSTVESF